MQRTFAVIKPDAVAAGHQSAILSRIQEEGLRIVAMKSLRLSKAQAEASITSTPSARSSATSSPS